MADVPSTSNFSVRGSSMNEPPQSDGAHGKGSESRTIWPGIGKGFAHEDLPKHLFTVAAMHARRALTAAENDRDQLDRATSISTAVELLAKAALALISPTLIAEKDPKSSWLYSGPCSSNIYDKTGTRN